jgi:DNA-binding LacI/PurR family transcriptional regulator
VKLTKPATIVDVAQAAGVSRSSASRALLGQPKVSPETVAKVLEAAERLGYTANAMAQGLANRHSGMLGGFVRDVSNVYYAELCGALNARAKDHHRQLLLTSGTWDLRVEDEIAAIRTLLSLRVDGMVIASSALPDEAILPVARHVPTVVMGRPETHPDLSSISLDEVAGGTAMAEHILQLGHRNVAVALVPTEFSLSQHARGRAMIDTLQAAGAVVRVINAYPDRPITEIVDLAVAQPHATALMCSSSPTCVAILAELDSRGISVPGQISVTSFDTTGPFGDPYLGLTSYTQPVAELGRRAVDLLVDMITTPSNPPARVMLRGEVVPGRTAGPAPR